MAKLTNKQTGWEWAHSGISDTMYI